MKFSTEFFIGMTAQPSTESKRREFSLELKEVGLFIQKLSLFQGNGWSISSTLNLPKENIT